LRSVRMLPPGDFGAYHYFDVGALPIENSISRKPHAYRESAPWCILAPGDDQHLAGSIQSQTSRHRRSVNDCKP
jgi:hypothetical protein